MKHFFQNYRRAINPPYSKKDLLPIAITLFLLIIIPLTVLQLNQQNIYHSRAAYSVKPTCLDKLQDQINAVGSGATIQVRTDCIYRETVTVTKPLIIDGQGGAEIRGSDIWGNSDWTQQGNYWISSKTLPKFYFTGTCESNAVDAPCHWPEQVFLDGTPLQQVATNSAPLTTGQFNLSSTRQIQLSDNPTNHVVEVTIRSSWIYAYADNVTIKGFTMKHANNAAQTGAIRNYRYGTPDNLQFSNMIIQNNVLSDAHGDVVSFIRGANNKLLNNDIFRGGDLGVHASSSNPLVQGNKIHDNNTEHYSTGWEAGGVKTAGLNGAVFDNNEVYNNYGRGLWCDGNCQNVTYSNNKAYNNTNNGIMFEISNGAKIYNNIVWNNGWRFKGNWGYGAGILIASSSNAEVYNNISAWDSDGIVVLSQCRAWTNPPTNTICDFTNPWNNVSDNYIHNNTMIMTPDPNDTGNNFSMGFIRDIRNSDGTAYTYMYSTLANNHGDNNLYWVPQPEGSTPLRFGWNPSTPYLATYATTPAGLNSRYLSDQERDQVLQAAGVPLTPGGTVPLTPTTTPTPLISTPTPALPTVTNTPVPPTSTPLPTPTPTKIPSTDTTKPTVNISSPLNGATVARKSNVTITASASDNVGVDHVTFSVAGNTSTDYSAPYSYVWSVPPGKPRTAYTITATAYDASNNSATSSIRVTSR